MDKSGQWIVYSHEKGTVMASPATEIDFIEELRLRRWARENYVPQPKRDGTWHPIIHDEMGRKDRDLRGSGSASPAPRA